MLTNDDERFFDKMTILFEKVNWAKVEEQPQLRLPMLDNHQEHRRQFAEKKFLELMFT
jgi:hypothetical protein